MEAAQSAHEKNLTALRKQLDHTKCTLHNLYCTVLYCTVLYCTVLYFLLSHPLFSAFSESSFLPFFPLCVFAIHIVLTPTATLNKRKTSFHFSLFTFHLVSFIFYICTYCTFIPSLSISPVYILKFII